MLSALALGLVLALPALGQGLPAGAPDAGQTLRDLQRPLPPAPRPAPVLVIPADTDTTADDGLRFAVRSVRVQGTTLVSAAEAQAQVDGLAGKEVTLAELRRAVRNITQLYRDRGYLLARAYVPAQTLDDGIVEVRVLEGQLGKTVLNNQSNVPSARAAAIADAQNPPGRPVHAATTDRALLLISDLPGAGAVTGTLNPGQTVGASDLLINITPGRDVEGDVGLDNHGNRYTGENRVSGRVAFNNPLALGDRLELRATASDRKLAYGRAAYDSTVGNDGLRAGVSLSTSQYELAREFANLAATGTARSATAYGSYAIVRGMPVNVWVSANLERRLLKDDVGATATENRKSAKTATVDLYGDASDTLADQAGYTSWRISLASGSLDIATAQAQAIDAQGPQTAGRYNKLQLSLRRVQGIAPGTRLSASFTGQKADKNLDSSEKFTLGGAYGVRAYPQGEGSGDEGYLANVELTRRLLPGFDAGVFIDQGHVRTSHTPYSAAPGAVTLRGYGLSGAYGFGARDEFTLNLSLAWRDGARPTSSPDKSPRLWLQGSWRF